ncbi:hypothetical protein HKD37_02G004500 [Glycine soja]
MGPLQMQAFRKADIHGGRCITHQYYDQPLRCFTFGDFQLVPTVEEFEKILGCPLGGRKPYLFSEFIPSLSKIAVVVRDSARELDRVKQTRNSVVGLPRKYLEGKVRDMANQEEWVPFVDVLALQIFGVVLFPNVDGLVDLAAIDAFLAYHYSKESRVVAILADLFDTFDRRCEKSSARIICCLPALCVWLVSHLFQQDIRHPCPLRSRCSCEKSRLGPTLGWDRRQNNQMEGKEGVLLSCGDYPNIPLIGTRGCINYNPALAIRQLGYPMRGALAEESLSPFLVRDFRAQSFKVIQKVHKAWESPLRKDKELRGIHNGIIGVRTRGLDWLSKLKVINKENFEAPEEDEEVRALKTELGKTRLAKEKFKRLLGRLWIHSVGVVPSTLHQKLKFVVEGHLVIVSGEEDILVSCPSSMPYVEAAEESLETAFQSFEVVSIASVDSFSGQPCLSDTAMMVARVMLGNGYEPGMGLGKNNGGRTSLISTRGNRGMFGLGYKPTQRTYEKVSQEGRAEAKVRNWDEKSKGARPATSVGHEGQVIAICEDDSPNGSDLVRPCPPGFRLGNRRVEERPDIYATSIM